jgi:hypothetical protein
MASPRNLIVALIESARGCVVADADEADLGACRDAGVTGLLGDLGDGAGGRAVGNGELDGGVTPRALHFMGD